MIQKWIIIFSYFLGTIMSAVTLSQEIIIATPEEYSDSYKKWIAQTPCHAIQNYNNPNASRQTIEIILICQALHLGGMTPTVTFIDVPNYARAIAEAQKGSVAMPSETLWDIDAASGDFYISDPVIRKGEYEKGFYTNPGNRSAIEQKLKADQAQGTDVLTAISNYSVVSSKTWSVDWATIENMQMKSLDTPKQSSMIKMVQNGRADFFLGEFTKAADMAFEYSGEKLLPVRGVKLGLAGSRHFVVSKNYPDSEKIYEALQKGLQQMRASGIILKAYSESGFFNQQVKDWQKVF